MTTRSSQRVDPAPNAPGSTGSDAGARRWVLDPRTAVVVLLAASITIMSPGGIWFVPAALVIATLMAISERACRRAVLIPLAAGAAAAVAYLLPLVAPWRVLGLVGVVAGFALRLVAVGGIAVHLVRTIPPSRFTAALRAARIPPAFTVSGSVLLRFVPTILSEARAVHDAMRLRGLGGALTVLRHPVRSIEYLTVPLMASSLRAAEDLSASSLLRGLGSHARPTSMHPPRFGLVDVVFAGVVVLLGAATFLLWYGS